MTHAELLFRGTVRTGDPLRPLADALAVADGVVVALDDAARAAADRTTEVIDLGGGALLPAFRDGHLHPLWGGMELLEAPLVGARSVDELIERVARYAAEHPELEWITGGGHDPTLAPGGVFLAEWLDRAVDDRPAFLLANDHHTAWVNTEALRRAGIDAATPDPDLGRIGRHGDGSPNGTLFEWTAQALVTRVMPERPPEHRAAGLDRAMAELARHGIVWGQEAAAAVRDLDVYLAAATAGRLTARVNVALWSEPGRWPDQRPRFVAARARAEAEGAGLVTARTVKMFADGVIEAGTAALLEPYADEPHSCGLPVWTAAELAEAAVAFDADGFQLHVHAIGDAGVRAALDAVEAAITRNGPRDRRPVIAHTQLVHPDDLPRFSRLGVIANFEPLWAQLDPTMVDLTLPRLGPVRGEWLYPMGGLARRGTRISFGSDWPVSSVQPLAGLAVAVTRRTPEGVPIDGWLPEERLGLDAALAAYSAGTAFQAFDDDRGRLTVGSPADAVWLGDDPAHRPPDELADLRVQGTWLDGRATFLP
ncbi:MAG TPA: amidohydrolase [Acidimicrobiales bacterium]|nr:amidohydrolase [Acidimicrobiales bacterium]